MSSLEDLLLESGNRLKGCSPRLQSAVLHVIKDLYELEGERFVVFQGLRSKAEQDALYAQGRANLTEVNRLRRKAGLHLIGEVANRKRVTGVRRSWHNFGVAADIVHDASPGKGISFSWKKIKAFLKIGKYARKHGLEWGGFWRSFKDYPHLQLPMSISLSEADGMASNEKIWTRFKR